MLYVSRVELKNFRCFENVIIEPNVGAASAPWTLLTGDNASGKTTLLKAIALGLCDGSSAAGLLRESDSGYIRYGKDKATIRIDLVDLVDGRVEEEYRVDTSLTRLNRQLESLGQKTVPRKDFPWDRIFVCGYGAGRGTSGAGDIAGYTAISAVYNLFNYSEGLQNPELTIRRLQPAKQARILETLKGILRLADVHLAENGTSDMGISVRDPHDVTVALRDLADGYKSTFLWVTDFLGWAVASGKQLGKPMDGIVIIDEIEQHLHPQWQKRIVSDLRETWPQVQVFAATHSPLVARAFCSISGDEPHRHYHLRKADGKGVEVASIEPLGGRRTDQILASEAFDYVVDDDPDSERILEELSYLAGNESLTQRQRERAEEYLEMVKLIQSIRLGQTDIELNAAQWAEMRQKSVIDELEQEI